MTNKTRDVLICLKLKHQHSLTDWVVTH